jgi:peptidyl-prolyl cis-trans isomerase C
MHIFNAYEVYNLAIMIVRRIICPVGIVFFLIMFISACGENTPFIPETAIPTKTIIPTRTMTPPPPSPTPIPLAATVNGEEITLQEFEAELSRYTSAIDKDNTFTEEEIQNIVLDDLVNQILLAQGANALDFRLEPQAIIERKEELVEALGGTAIFEDWLLENGYTQQSFDKALARAIKGAWMRDRILGDVPQSAEQVHARQILLYNSEQAEQVLTELNSGREFATLVAAYEPVTLGELGWFPQGYLPHLEVEEAAFNLQPGEYSQVIETTVGFHIIQVLERDSNRPLSPEAYLAWQENALKQWMAMQREASTIVILIPQESE